MTKCSGVFRTATAAEAVARAFGVQPEHVEVESIDREAGSWRWRFTEAAPVVVDAEIVSLDFIEAGGRRVAVGESYHPAIKDGVAVEEEIGWVVIFGDGGEADLLNAAVEYFADLGACR